MITTIMTAAAVYIATSIDNLIILLVFFAYKKDNPALIGIVLGKVIGTSILIAVSLLVAFGLRAIPEQWIVGLLGLIPLGLGLKVLTAQEEEVLEKINVSANKYSNLLRTVAVLTIASGGDNLAVYIPLFTALSQAELAVTVLVFYLGVALLCYTGYRLAKIPLIGGTIEKYERIIVPFVFIGLGIMIMFENGTIAAFIELFM